MGYGEEYREGYGEEYREEYMLRISVDESNSHLIEGVMGVATTKMKFFWQISIKEGDSFFSNAVKHFMDLVDDNILALNEIGVERRDIDVWFYKNYEKQCNMEFSPELMGLLSKKGMTLCISCFKISRKIDMRI